MTEKPFEEDVIDDVLSKAEQRAFIYRLREVMRRGFGKVSITVEKGHPRRIETTDSETLPNETSEVRRTTDGGRRSGGDRSK